MPDEFEDIRRGLTKIGQMLTEARTKQDKNERSSGEARETQKEVNHEQEEKEEA